MAIKKRIMGPVVFASTLAGALAAMAAAALSPGRAQAVLNDVQIGERGQQTRIAFLCGGACVLEKNDSGEIILHGLRKAFELDLVARKSRLKFVKARQDARGLVLQVGAKGDVDHTKVKECTVGGRPAACLDLFFAPPSAETVEAPARTIEAAAAPAAPSRKIARARPQIRDEATVTPEKITVAAAPPPPLRESAPSRFDTYAQLSSPERLPPPTGALLAKLQPLEPSVVIGKPALRQEKPVANPARADYSARVRGLLGKELSPAYCNNAEVTLQTDAWALGAMVDVGLCAAARGDAVEADAVLARLLEYTPDNYEAFVGRALIAEEAGEKGVARKYYQDALNALPPIAESNRIVQAMASL